MKPTASVQNALDEAVSEAVKLIKQWQKVSADREPASTKGYSDNNNEVLR